MPAVLQVVLSLNPGGTERLVVDLVRRLRSRFDIAVCCLDEPGSWGVQLAADGVRVEALRRKPGFRPELGRRVRGIARATGAGVLHCHQYSPFIYGCLARALMPSLSVVFTEHGRLDDAPPSRKRRLVNPLAARMADRIAAVSYDLRRHMTAEGFPASRIEVVHNGIDPGRGRSSSRDELRTSLGLSENTIALGTVARLDPVKHLTTALDALGILRQEGLDVVLVVAGDGPERDALRAHAQRTAVDAHVRWLGHRDDARRWLEACDVYVNTSISEGISLTVLEGMAAGLPIVATAVGGTPEIVDAACGTLVAPRNPEALAEAIRPLITDPALRCRMGTAARQRILSAFTLDRMVERYAAMYEELL